jgi:hypothetical protein
LGRGNTDGGDQGVGVGGGGVLVDIGDDLDRQVGAVSVQGLGAPEIARQDRQRQTKPAENYDMRQVSSNVIISLANRPCLIRHGTVMAACRRTMADALIIEGRAQCRLADEYDAAQERGEVNKAGGHRLS